MSNMALYSYSNRAAKRKRYLRLGLEGKNLVQYCLTHPIFEESPIVVACPNAPIDQRTTYKTASQNEFSVDLSSNQTGSKEFVRVQVLE